MKLEARVLANELNQKLTHDFSRVSVFINCSNRSSDWVWIKVTVVTSRLDISRKKIILTNIPIERYPAISLNPLTNGVLCQKLYCYGVFCALNLNFKIRSLQKSPDPYLKKLTPKNLRESWILQMLILSGTTFTMPGLKVHYALTYNIWYKVCLHT